MPMPETSDLLQFKSIDGSTLTVEVSDPGRDFGPENVGRVRDGVQEAGQTLEEAFGSVTPALRNLAKTIAQFAPDEHSVEFGLKLNAQIGALIAKSSAEAHFVVKMTWKKPSGD